MGVKPSTVELHIEQLRLAGFPRGQRHAIGDALEAELTRLLADYALELPGAAVDLERVNAGSIRVTPGSPARSTGVQIARALMGGIARPQPLVRAGGSVTGKGGSS